MKNKFLLSAMFLLLLVGLYTPASYSQYAFKCTLANEVQTGATVSFDVYIGNTGTYPLTVYTFQQGLTYRVSGCNGQTGLLSAAWSNVNATVASLIPPKAPNVATAGVVKLAASAPLAGPGAGVSIPQVPVVTNSVADLGLRWGTVTLTNKAGVAFTTDTATGLHVTWCFVTAQYPTKVQSTFGADGSTPSAYDVTVNGTYGYYNTFYVGVLPVELSSFASTTQGRSVVLSWSTKTEKNSDRFDVERSLVSTSVWSVVGTVKASVLSNSTKSYSFTDTKLQSGKYQYRLKMVDNDGTSSYSSVEAAEVAVPKDFAVSQNYPNPFNPSTRIDYSVPMDSKVIMEVYNIAGQRVSELVNQNQTAGYYTVDFGATKLSSGVYIYRISAQENATGKNFSSIRKMMLLK